MGKTVYVLISCLLMVSFLSGCDKKGSGESGVVPLPAPSSPGTVPVSSSSDDATTTDPYLGTYFWTALLKSSDVVYTEAYIKADKVTYYQAIFPKGNMAVAYYAKNEGTYVKSGNNYTVTYTYQTCNPVGSEVYKITGSNPDDIIGITQQGTTYPFKNFKSHTAPIDFKAIAALQEDDSTCSHFSQ